MSRGIDRQPIFVDDRDREHFLELLEKAVERYRIKIHVFVLMSNHFHLLLQTPEGNLGAGMQWIKQSYSMWYNVRHDRVGPLFQGRYRSIPVEDAGWIYELSQYVHLNPLRLARFKLSRLDRQREAMEPYKPLGKAEATRRLRELRSYRWSSYRAYAGYVAVPPWLSSESILERAGCKDRRRSYRKAVMARLTAGEEADVLERLRGALAIGSELFREQVKEQLRKADREISGHRAARGKVALEKVIEAVEIAIGEPVRKEKRGGTGRDLVLKIARDVSGLTLKELGEKMGGLDYVTVHLAVRRMQLQMEKSSSLKSLVAKIKHQILK
jgi:putative transposase